MEIIESLEPIYFYLFIVVFVSTFLLMRGLFIIQLEKRRRLKSAENLEYQDAVLPPDESTHSSIMSEHAAHHHYQESAVQSIETRFEFMRRFYVPLVLFVSGIFIALPFLPALPATYLSLLTGLIAGVFGLAARPVIENAIAGMVLTFSQPIRLNDTVIIDGQYGTVEQINMLHTTIKIWNWRRLVIPNHNLLQREIENLSLGETTEWAFIKFNVEPWADLELVKKLAIEAMDSEFRLPAEEPSFWVIEMEKDSILCWVAAWAANPPSAWDLKSTGRERLSQKLREHGIHFHIQNTQFQRGSKPKATAPIRPDYN